MIITRTMTRKKVAASQQTDRVSGPFALITHCDIHSGSVRPKSGSVHANN